MWQRRPLCDLPRGSWLMWVGTKVESSRYSSTIGEKY
jgi:hypothetical protein